MAKESIKKIRDAEQKAAEIIENAEQKAAEMIAAAEQKGRSHLEKATADRERENREKLALVRAKTDEMLNDSRIRAEESAMELKKIAQPRVRNAVKLIVQGIFEQCQ